MKKFQFRLEKVLQYRHRLKDERLRDLNLCFKRLREAEEKLEYLESEYKGNLIPENGVLMIEQLHIQGAYSERLKGEIANLNLTILRLQEEVEVARLAYIEATKEAEVLEKLKEKKKEVYNLEVSKHEEKFLDELTTQKGSTVTFK